MPEVAVMTDDKVASVANITSGADKVYYKGKKVAIVTSTVADHDGHSGVTITGGSSKIFIVGKKLARKGDSASCGHTITSGRPALFAA